jgi:hypothetical protein
MHLLPAGISWTPDWCAEPPQLHDETRRLSKESKGRQKNVRDKWARNCVKSKNLLRFREPSLFAALSELHDDFDKDKTNTSLLVRIRASLALVPVQSSAKIGLKPPD